jgi:hypothetical protein
VLKAPENKRLKLSYDGLVSSFAFKFKLRRYIVVDGVLITPRAKYILQGITRANIMRVATQSGMQAQAYTRSLFSAT